MKFGKLLSRRAIQAEPYKSAYVNYKHLKHVIKDEKKKDSVQVGDPQDKTKVPGHAAFFFALAAEAKKVDALYHSQLDKFRAELAPLVTQINALRDAGQPVPQEVFVAFTSLCKRLDELRAFIVMNYLAFMKILKKFDKKLQQNVKEGVFEFIQERPFYCSHELAELLTQTEVVMNMLSGRSRREDYNCPVCLNILSNPVVLSCAHRFCWHCLAKASLFKQCCPVCRKQQTLDPRHYHVDSALQTFLQEHFPQGAPAPSAPGPAAPVSPAPALSEASSMSSPSTAAPMAVDAAPTPQSTAADMESPPHSPSPPTASALALPPTHEQDAASTPTPIAPDQNEEPTQEGLENRLQNMTVKEQEVMMDLDVMPNNVIQISAFARLLRHKGAGNIVILDLDETVVMTPTHSVLFSHEGIKAFEAYIHNMPTDTAAKVQHCQNLQRILDDKVACEPDTVSIIRQLQQSGAWVMACTARYANMAPRTQQTLSALGVDLNINAPFPPNRALQDPETEAVYANGVIFTNAVDKGEVLNSFLENVVFRGVRKERAPDGTVRWSKPLPHEIVFVDDRYSNSESVLRGLHVAQKLSVPIISYHYVGATMRAPRLDLAPNSRHSRLLRTQITKFIESGVVLTDEQCEKLIR